MILLREKPYAVQANGERGAKIRLASSLQGYYVPGDILYLYTEGDRLILSRSKSELFPIVGSEVIRQSGTFFGVHIPKAARDATGLQPGVRYLMWQDYHYIKVEKYDEE